jgi:hypothetical protein
MRTLGDKYKAWRFAGWADSAILLVAGRARFSRHEQAGARCPSGLRERSAKPPFVGSNPTRASNFAESARGGRRASSNCAAELLFLPTASGPKGTVSLNHLISGSNLLSP